MLSVVGCLRVLVLGLSSASAGWARNRRQLTTDNLGARTPGSAIGTIVVSHANDMLPDRIRSVLNRSPAEIVYGIAWKLGARFGAPKPLQRAIFQRIFATNAWGDSESV